MTGIQRIGLAVIAFAFLIAVGVGGVVIGRSTTSSGQPGASSEAEATDTPSTSAPNDGPLISTQERDTFERALNNRGTDGVSTVVSRLLNDAKIVRGDRILPAGSTVFLDWNTLADKEDGFATVEATVQGPLAGQYKLLLIREGATWKLLRTERLP